MNREEAYKVSKEVIKRRALTFYKYRLDIDIATLPEENPCDLIWMTYTKEMKEIGNHLQADRRWYEYETVCEYHYNDYEQEELINLIIESLDSFEAYLLLTK